MKWECIGTNSTRCHFRRPFKDQYQPAKSNVSSVNKRKYLKLYNGDIYCVETNTILDQNRLQELLTIL